tara:strand:- start:131 stop:628 length:498 start_codon:yes stop_codon:yes gene_type:complete
MGTGVGAAAATAEEAWGNCTSSIAGGWRTPPRTGVVMSARRCADLCFGCRHCLTYSVSVASGECLWAQRCTIGRDARFAAQRLTHAAELPAPRGDEGWAEAAGALFSTVLLKARELRHLQAAKGVGNGAAAGKGRGSGGGGAAAGRGKGKGGGGAGVTLKVRGMG